VKKAKVDNVELSHRMYSKGKATSSRRLIINTITRGLASGGSSSNSRKRHLREVMKVKTIIEKDMEDIIKNHNDLMLIRVVIAKTNVGRILVDQGSSANILSYDAFKQMKFKDADLLPHDTTLITFLGNKIILGGYLE